MRTSILQTKQLGALEWKATCQVGPEEALTPFSWVECSAGTVLNEFTPLGSALPRGENLTRGQQRACPWPHFYKELVLTFKAQKGSLLDQ